MSQETAQDHISRKRVAYTMPGVDAVTVRRDEPYRASDTGPLTMDLYRPPDSSGARLPAVVVVGGYPGLGVQRVVGCKFKEMGSSVSWGRLLAASGMVAITYENREPASDLQALLHHVRDNAAALGIDERSLGVWASSGNAPLALSVLMHEAGARIKCAALCYGYMLDLAGSGAVAEAAQTWRFANPCAGKAVADLARDTPLFIARAGQDQTPRLNESIDRFLAEALACNLPLTFVNLPAAPHAFDLFDDSAASREVVEQILKFLRFHLMA